MIKFTYRGQETVHCMESEIDYVRDFQSEEEWDEFQDLLEEMRLEYNAKVKAYNKTQRTMFHGLVRTALSGKEAGPPIWDIMHVLGKVETIKRLRAAAEICNESSPACQY